MWRSLVTTETRQIFLFFFFFDKFLCFLFFRFLFIFVSFAFSLSENVYVVPVVSSMMTRHCGLLCPMHEKLENNVREVDLVHGFLLFPRFSSFGKVMSDQC